LARQLARVDAMIADPTAKVTEWQVGVLENHPEKLASRADAFMTGIERAAAITGRLRYAARESGRILAGLVANLPMTASSRSPMKEHKGAEHLQLAAFPGFGFVWTGIGADRQSVFFGATDVCRSVRKPISNP
jgi:hypothetical protein